MRSGKPVLPRFPGVWCGLCAPHPPVLNSKHPKWGKDHLHPAKGQIRALFLPTALVSTSLSHTLPLQLVLGKENL